MAQSVVRTVARTVAEGARALAVVYAVVQVGATGALRGPFFWISSCVRHLGAFYAVVRPHPNETRRVVTRCDANITEPGSGEHMYMWHSYVCKLSFGIVRSFFLSDSQPVLRG